ncbi:MAG: hypothetical protein H0W24_08950 [Lysobacter sp.]|nr:hypothetical protein [Lysobacter sp.]
MRLGDGRAADRSAVCDMTARVRAVSPIYRRSSSVEGARACLPCRRATDGSAIGDVVRRLCAVSPIYRFPGDMSLVFARAALVKAADASTI